MKPETDFYPAALEVAESEASQTIYIDDDIGNVRVAKELGMRSHHFTGIDGLAEFLADSRAFDTSGPPT